jgi:ABC-type nitrate/sulfonate/bicarbonate transport system substrate-binding protein
MAQPSGSGALTIAVAFPVPFYAPLWVARRLGAFDREGLDARIATPPPGETIALLERGEAQVALSGVMRRTDLASGSGACSRRAG